jgi:hypothetical protein
VTTAAAAASCPLLLAAAATILAAAAPSPRAGSWCCDYHDDTASLSGFGAPNSEGLAELLVGFFCYWARQHDYRHAVVSVRVGGGLTKADKGW